MRLVTPGWQQLGHLQGARLPIATAPSLPGLPAGSSALLTLDNSSGSNVNAGASPVINLFAGQSGRELEIAGEKGGRSTMLNSAPLDQLVGRLHFWQQCLPASCSHDPTGSKIVLPPSSACSA